MSNSSPRSLPLDLGVVVLLLFLLSGAAALIYQVAFVRAFVELYGSTTGSLGAVVGAFLLCLTTGALAASWLADRTSRPLRLYAALEAVAAVGGLIAWFAIDRLEPIATSLAERTLRGEDVTLTRFAIAIAILAIPIGALGATLPVLARARLGRGRGAAAGGLQAANTIGAVVGVLVASLILLPMLGMRSSMLLAAVINLVVAVLSWLIGRTVTASSPSTRSEEGPAAPAFPYLAAALFSGFFVVAVEVLAFRGMAQVVRGGIDSVGVLLACVLIAQALGTMAGTIWSRKARPRTGFLIAQAGAVFGVVWGLSVLFRMADHQLWSILPDTVLSGGQAAESLVGRWFGEAIGTMLVVGPAMFFAGMAFPCVCQLRPRGGMGFGRWVALQSGLWSLGAATAGLLAHPHLLAEYGLKTGLWICAAIPAVAIVLVTAFDARQFWQRPRWIPAAGFAVAITAVSFVKAGDEGMWDRPLLFFRAGMQPGSVLLDYREGEIANISVVAGPNGQKNLKVNNQLSLGGSGALKIEGMQALVPTMLHPQPRRALALGVGAGITVGTLLHAGLAEVDAVEIAPSVHDVLPFFALENGGAAHITRDGERWVHPALRLHEEDARTFVRGAPKEGYDLIIGDLFFPWQSEAGFLYTREHFERIHELLAEGGVFCQWLPAHQMPWEDLGVVGRTFAEVFDGATMWLARVETPFPVVALVAGKEHLRIHVPSLEERFDNFYNPDLLKQYDLTDAHEFLGLYVADEFLFKNPNAFESTDINTVDRPVVEFQVARRVETDGVTALHNRQRIFDIREDVIGRMSTAGLEQAERKQLQIDLTLSAKVAGERFRAATLRGFADAYRLNPPEHRPLDPRALDKEAFEVLQRAYHASPDTISVAHDIADLLTRQLDLGQFAWVIEGVTSLFELEQAREFIQFWRLRGTALLYAAHGPPLLPTDYVPDSVLQERYADLVRAPLVGAERDLQRALSLEENDMEARMYLGVIQFLLEKNDAAKGTLGSVREQLVAQVGVDPNAGPVMPTVPEAIHQFLAGEPRRAELILVRSFPLPYVPAVAKRMREMLDEAENG